MNKVGGILAYIFWVGLGFAIGVFFTLNYLCPIW